MKRISTFFYTIGQGFRGLTRNRWYTLASIATISACLFLFGLFYTIVLNFQNMVRAAEEGVSVTVFFDQGVTEEQILAIQSALEQRTEVRKVDYISADMAWEGFKEGYLGPYADGFTENPLVDSANLQIYLSDVSMQPGLVTFLESIQGVREVNRSEVTATTLSGINRLVAYISIAIIAILFGVSIFLISNTVTIGISVRQDEITIMKYIGATDYFVRAPFVIECMLIGAIGSAIPLGVIYFVYGQITEFISGRFAILSNLLRFLPIETIFERLVPATFIIGVGIGFIGSFVTVRRHLRV
ncbi:MAG: permease-like cell division protein FtsX [Lachnospiraceae bacterium]|nr:permease-like cell division protein FtsX [Lachnospiraceae bacterium]